MYEQVNNLLSKDELLLVYEKIKRETNGFASTGATITLLGPTGVGKTVISNAMAEYDVVEILMEREGHGLASLVPTNVHPTDIVPKGTVLVVAQMKKQIMDMDKEKEFFISALYTAGSVILKKTNTSSNMSYEQIRQEFEKDLKTYYYNAILKKDNTSFAHMFSFITKEQQEEMIGKMVSAFGEIPINELIELIRDIGNSAKKGTEEKQALQEIGEKLDSDWSKQSQLFWEHCRELTDQIKKSAFIHGTYDEVADCLYIWLTKESPAEEREMFLSSEDKSVEFIFEKMDIYYRISDEFRDYINTNALPREMLKTRYGEIFFTIRDTRGLFHKTGDVKEAAKEAKSYIYDNESDLVLFFISSKEDALSKKALMVLKDLKENVKRNVEMVILMPRVDELVPQLNIKVTPQNRFSGNAARQALDTSIIVEKICERRDYVKESINSIINDSKRFIHVRDVIPYGMYSNECPSEIIKEFDPNNSFLRIIDHLSSAVSEGTRKIHVHVDRMYDDIEFEWNTQDIEQMINDMITSSPVFKTSVYLKVIDNIWANKDLMPHGNGARSIINNSKSGYGHNSDIDTTWYRNVQPVDIQFPPKLWVIATGIINSSILRNIELQHGVFASNEDRELFFNILTSAFTQAGNGYIMHAGRRLSAKLFYHNHIKPLEQQGYFSNSMLVQNALKRCFSAFSLWNTGNTEEIVKAYMEVVNEACNIIKDKYIVFDK